jgi:hypothetical protein
MEANRYEIWGQATPKLIATGKAGGSTVRVWLESAYDTTFIHIGGRSLLDNAEAPAPYQYGYPIKANRDNIFYLEEGEELYAYNAGAPNSPYAVFVLFESSPAGRRVIVEG